MIPQPTPADFEAYSRDPSTAGWLMIFGLAVPPILAAGIPGPMILAGTEAWYLIADSIRRGVFVEETGCWKASELDPALSAPWGDLRKATEDASPDTAAWGTILTTSISAMAGQGCPWEDIESLVAQAIEGWEHVKTLAAMAPEKAGKVIHLGPKGGE